jgi:hypothetical protein
MIPQLLIRFCIPGRVANPLPEANPNGSLIMRVAGPDQDPGIKIAFEFKKFQRKHLHLFILRFFFASFI